MADEIDRWLDGLSGRIKEDSRSREEVGAESLRRVLLEREQHAGHQIEPDPHGLDRLLFRLRREGLLKVPQAWNRPPLWIGLAASVLLASAMIVLLPHFEDSDEQSTLTRGLAKPQQLQRASPRESAEVLRKELEGLGAKVRIQTGKTKGEIILDATIPEDREALALAVVHKYGLNLPKSLHLVVAIKP